MEEVVMTWERPMWLHQEPVEEGRPRDFQEAG